LYTIIRNDITLRLRSGSALLALLRHSILVLAFCLMNDKDTMTQ